jgi:hypothetical protein
MENRNSSSSKSSMQQKNEDQDKMLDDLQSKYNVDRQEVLNAVIASNSDRSKAEEYLRERTEKK